MMMETISTTETSVNFYEATRRNIPEGCQFAARRDAHGSSHTALSKANKQT
jgi:hypothetical protein